MTAKQAEPNERTEQIVIDGIRTRLRVTGSGPAVLMYSPGGFDASLENWHTFGNYRELRLIEKLSARYTCVTFDRRESGLSGGRVERIRWDDYVHQGLGVLDHLGLEEVFVMGGCVGCSSAAALAVAEPGRVLGMVLISPAGGGRISDEAASALRSTPSLRLRARSQRRT
ncbi:alpha/beta hydrolase [Glaciihabitans sp. UYNi722]|uniref:alpha/beta fold hydrolase n=1 Tax=Glaciihabitans sp. UYNi722 TaxID=3156344 RepID=UPI003391A716